MNDIARPEAVKPSTTQEPDLTDLIQELERGVGEVHEEIQSLTERLNEYLTPGSQENQGLKESDFPTEKMRQVDDIGQKLFLARNRLRDLRCRLRL